jgi:hypothetical protein
MRPTDVCHPIELRAPAPRVFPVRARHFRSGETPWRVRLHAALPGDRTFHDARKTASADRHSEQTSDSTASRPGVRTWAFSSHGTDATEPLTPLSRFPHFSHWSRLREIHRRTRKSPRPPPSPTRESLRRILIRGAFHRQGLFVGFGGHDSPGPATTSPLLAMV